MVDVKGTHGLTRKGQICQIERHHGSTTLSGVDGRQKPTSLN